jgi:hypothetical protein
MIPTAIALEIVLESLKLANKIIDGIPEDVREEQARQIWNDWKKVIAFLQGEKA